MSAASSARAVAALEASFLSGLSGWKLANQELDSVASLSAREASRLEELELVGAELALLEPGALLYRMVGPILQPMTVDEGRRVNEQRARSAREEHARLTKRQQALAQQQKQRRSQLLALQRQLPHIPDSIYSV